MEQTSREPVRAWPFIRANALQITFCAVLVAVGDFAILFALPSLREQRIANEITSHGGKVAFQNHGLDWIPQSIHSRIPFCSRIESVTLEGEEFGDAPEVLGSLTDLKALNLIQTQTTDAGLKHLKNLIGLETLVMAGSQVTDSGLEHLKGMKRLATLVIIGAQVNDSGLECLKGLTSLKFLNLRRTQITDLGL